MAKSRSNAAKSPTEAPTAPAPKKRGRPVGAKTDPQKRAITLEKNRRERALASGVPVDALAAQLPLAPASAIRYSPDLAAAIILRVANGETLTAVCREIGMDRTTFNSWVVAYPELREAWMAARRVKAGALFDEALDIARDLKENRKDAVQVNALRVATETLKWAAAKLSPQEYGDKMADKPVVAIQINTGLDLGPQSRDTESSVSGLFAYSLSARLPEPSTSAEIIEGESVPKRKDPAQARATYIEVPEGSNE